MSLCLGAKGIVGPCSLQQYFPLPIIKLTKRKENVWGLLINAGEKKYFRGEGESRNQAQLSGKHNPLINGPNLLWLTSAARLRRARKSQKREKSVGGKSNDERGTATPWQPLLRYPHPMMLGRKEEKVLGNRGGGSQGSQ